MQIYGQTKLCRRCKWGGSNYILQRGLPGGRKVGLGAGPKVKVPQGAV